MEDIKERIKEISANLMLCKIAINQSKEVVDPEMVDNALFAIIRELDGLASELDNNG